MAVSSSEVVRVRRRLADRLSDYGHVPRDQVSLWDVVVEIKLARVPHLLRDLGVDDRPSKYREIKKLLEHELFGPHALIDQDEHIRFGMNTAQADRVASKAERLLG